MTEDLKASIDLLRKVSPKLNKATDEAHEVVAEVERFLNNECSIGVRAIVGIDEEDLPEDRRRDTYLVYDRVDGKYRIAVETVLVENVQMEGMSTVNAYEATRYCREDITPWVSCPRHIKLESFPKLPRLLKYIGEKVQEIASLTNDAIKAVKETRKAMGK